MSELTLFYSVYYVTVYMLKDYDEVKRNAEDREAWRAITRQPST